MMSRTCKSFRTRLPKEWAFASYPLVSEGFSSANTRNICPKRWPGLSAPKSRDSLRLRRRFLPLPKESRDFFEAPRRAISSAKKIASEPRFLLRRKWVKMVLAAEFPAIPSSAVQIASERRCAILVHSGWPRKSYEKATNAVLLDKRGPRKPRKSLEKVTSSKNVTSKRTNPHAHNNKIGTSTPPSKKSQHPPKRRNFMGIGGFPAERTKKCQAPINWRSHFRPQNCGRRLYGHHAFLWRHACRTNLPPKNF